jgi:serine/threonine-protein kinase
MNLLQGCYQIRQEISRGMEITYLGEDTRLERPVFIKELALPEDADASEVEKARARFHSQALTGALVDHPNVVKTLDAFEADGRSFIVLEYVEGRSLKDLLEEHGKLPLPRAISLTAQVLDALETAGAAGVVHGDIKPGNILLTGDDVVKVVDFGIAVREGQKAPQRAGTPNYLAPEQLRGRALDRRADLFSASVLLYHLASGERPFAAPNVKGILERIEYEEPAMPSYWSPALCGVLRKGLAKEPGSRYASARAMLHDLRAAAGGATDEPDRSSRGGRVVEALAEASARERRTGLVLAACGGVAVVALTLIARLVGG